MPKVILSTGHTNKNPGTVANGLREYDVARNIVKEALPYLRESGIIALSVPPDLNLDERVNWINKIGGKEEDNDIVVEIHLNDGGDSGVEGWFESEGYNKSEKLTKTIVKEVALGTEFKNLGAKSEFDHELGSLAFLHDTLQIATLIECGYLDNEKDAEYLKNPDNIKKIGKSIAKGITSFLNIDFKDIKQEETNNTLKSSKLQNIASSTKPIVSPPIQNNTNMSQSNFMSDNYFTNSPNSFSKNNDNKTALTRDERREMIKKNYIKILGREPNDNDLNYFLNIAISEEQLIKKMVDSQEHVELVKARQEVVTCKQELNDRRTEFVRLQTKVEDQNAILKQQYNALQEKNRMIAILQNRIINYQKLNLKPVNQNPQKPVNYSGSFLDKIFRAFSDLFE